MISLREPGKNIILIAGPSGAGKDTLIKSVIKNGEFEKVVTTTTRPKRDHEENGNPYYFLSPEEFEAKIKAGNFVEYSQNENGAYYGVQETHLEEVLQHEKKIIWIVDWKGVLNIKKIFPDVKSICVIASPDTLTKRIRTREGKNYSESYFQERIDYAKAYFAHLDDYDYVIWNEDEELEKSVQEFKTTLEKITGT